MTDVVAALIWENGRFMICQRPQTKSCGLLWEFVGGKVEKDESKEQALKRECREELGIDLSVGDIFTEVIHEYPDITVHLTLFNAVIADGFPQKLEHNDIRWITPEEIQQYNFCPADIGIVKKIAEEYYSTETEKKMKRVYDFLKKADVYYLATVEDNQPRVRPFGTINKFEGKLYIQTGKIKPVSHQLAENPRVEICAFADGTWIRIACELVEDDRTEARKSMLDAYPDLRRMYDENDGNTQVFYIKDAKAAFCAFGKEAEIIRF